MRSSRPSPTRRAARREASRPPTTAPRRARARTRPTTREQGGAPGEDQEGRAGREGQDGSPGSPESLPQVGDLRPSDDVVAQAVGVGSSDYLDDVDEGAETLLSTKRLKHAAFFNRVKRGVAQNWKPDRPTGCAIHRANLRAEEPLHRPQGVAPAGRQAARPGGREGPSGWTSSTTKRCKRSVRAAVPQPADGPGRMPARSSSRSGSGSTSRLSRSPRFRILRQSARALSSAAWAGARRGSRRGGAGAVWCGAALTSSGSRLRLLGDGEHGVGERVERLLGLGLGGLDHERAGHRPAGSRSSAGGSRSRSAAWRRRASGRRSPS